MDYEPKPIEVVVGPNGPMLGSRGFPHVALVDPDIPERFSRLAVYVTSDKKTMRVTIGDMWAIYRLKGFTSAGDQMWTLWGTRYTGSQQIQFSFEAGDEAQKKQIEGWLLHG